MTLRRGPAWDKVPSSFIGMRADRLNRQAPDKLTDHADVPEAS